MYKQLLGLFILLFCLNANSQSIIVGTVIDTDNKAPIAYVNIGIEGESVGTVSAPSGTFSLNIPDSLMNAKIVFSSIGYKTYKSTVKQFLKGKNQKNLLIALNPAAYAMDEIIVTKSTLRSKTLGIKTTTKNVSGGYADDKLGCEFAQKIKLKRKEKVLLDQFYVSIASNTCDSIFFRLNFYEKKGRKPGKNITPVNIIIASDIKEGVINVDLSPYEIWMEDDFFIGLEWIRDFCPEANEEGLDFSGKLFKSLYYKSTSFDKWRKLKIMGIGMWLEVKSNK